MSADEDDESELDDLQVDAEDQYADQTEVIFGCACVKDADELVILACGAHRIEFSTERRIRDAMDLEIDAAIFDLTGSRPVRRKDGAVFGTFAIDRKR